MFGDMWVMISALGLDNEAMEDWQSSWESSTKEVAMW